MSIEKTVTLYSHQLRGIKEGTPSPISPFPICSALSLPRSTVQHSCLSIEISLSVYRGSSLPSFVNSMTWEWLIFVLAETDKKEIKKWHSKLDLQPVYAAYQSNVPNDFRIFQQTNSAVCHFRNVFVFICMNWRKTRGPHYDLNSEFGRQGEIEIFERFCIVEFDQHRAISHCALRQFNEIFVIVAVIHK